MNDSCCTQPPKESVTDFPSRIHVQPNSGVVLFHASMLAYLLVHIELAENLGCVEQVLVLEYLLSVPGEEGKVENQRDPVAVDQEERRQQRVDRGLGNNVRVEAVAEVDGVDVIAVYVATVSPPRQMARLPCQGRRVKLRLPGKVHTIPDRCT